MSIFSSTIDSDSFVVLIPSEELKQRFKKAIANIKEQQKRERKEYIRSERRKTIAKELCKRKYFGWFRNPKKFLSFKEIEEMLEQRLVVNNDGIIAHLELRTGMRPETGVTWIKICKDGLKAFEQTKLASITHPKEFIIPLHHYTAILGWAEVK